MKCIVEQNQCKIMKIDITEKARENQFGDGKLKTNNFKQVNIVNQQHTIWVKSYLHTHLVLKNFTILFIYMK